MANGDNKRLRAFVRFDGSGRVVAGSLILRKNKPKVGKWVEISAYECCNPPAVSSMKIVGTGQIANCSADTTNGTTVYFATSTIVDGTALFTDAALTIPFVPDTYQYHGQNSKQSITFFMNNSNIATLVDDCNATTTTTTTIPATTTTTTTNDVTTTTSSSTSTSTTSSTTTVLG